MLKLSLDREGAAPTFPPNSGYQFCSADGTEWAQAHAGRGRHHVVVPGLGVFAFGAGELEVLAYPEAGVHRDRIEESFRRDILPIALHALGNEVLHASAIVARDGVIGFSGPTHAGKSTLAFALSGRGFRVFADDALAFAVQGRAVMAVPLPFALRLRAGARQAFNTEGWSRAPARPFGGSPLPLAALLLLSGPAPSGRAVQLQPVAPRQAFRRLLRQAFCFSVEELERKRRMVRSYLKISEAVPVFELRFIRHYDRLPALLAGLERELTARFGGAVDLPAPER